MKKCLTMLIGVALLTVIAGQAWGGWYLQLHYIGNIPDVKNVKYQWTNKNGECASGWFPVGLARCVTEKIPWPEGGWAQDVIVGPGDGITVKKCFVDHSTALRQEAGQWISAMPSWFEEEVIPSGHTEIYWNSGFEHDTLDGYSGVDLSAWFRAGAPLYPACTEFHIVNGVCDQLPGYIFGTTPTYIDPVEGLKTDNPMVDAIVMTTIHEGLCPEPSCLLALAAGLAALGCAIRRRR